jgi:hypothetical protein
MKFYTPDKTILIDVTKVSPHPDGILIEGKIMGAMPMKAVLRPDELRAGFSLLSRPLITKIFGMLLRRGAKA